MPAIPGSAEQDADAGPAAGVSVLALAVAVALAVRIALPPPLLNLFISYTTEAGALYEKIHPGGYLILLLLPLAALTRPVRVRRDELPMLRALVAFCIGVAATALLLVLARRAGSAGYFVDTYLTAGAGGLLLVMLAPRERRLIATLVLALLCLSALVGIGEAVTRRRVLPYDMAELDFRPTGLAGHPLMLGLMSASAIGFALAMHWRLRTRLLVAALLVLATVAAEARFATIMSAVTLLLIATASPWPGFTPRQARRAKFLLVGAAVVAVVPVVALLQAAGFLSRLNEGLVDDSSLARIGIYFIFGLVEPREILFGTDLARIAAIAAEELNIGIIESTPVVLIFQLGLPGAIAFAALLVYLFVRLTRHVPVAGRIATLSFFVIALSNITLSTKTAAVLTIVVLLVAAQRPAAATAVRAPAERPD